MHRYGVREVEKLLRSAAQHDSRVHPGRIRIAFARTAKCLAVLIPGSDRPSHGAGAGCSQGAWQADHQLREGTSPPSSRFHAAVRTEYLRSGRPRGRQGRRRSLAGGIRAVPPRIRGRSSRRVLERGWRNGGCGPLPLGAHGAFPHPPCPPVAGPGGRRMVREGDRAGAGGRRRGATGVRARCRRRSGAPRCAYQSGAAPARSRAILARPNMSTARR